MQQSSNLQKNSEKAVARLSCFSYLYLQGKKPPWKRAVFVRQSACGILLAQRIPLAVVFSSIPPHFHSPFSFALLPNAAKVLSFFEKYSSHSSASFVSIYALKKWKEKKRYRIYRKKQNRAANITPDQKERSVSHESEYRAGT